MSMEPLVLSVFTDQLANEDIFGISWQNNSTSFLKEKD